jgi:hypothetical protein
LLAIKRYKVEGLGQNSRYKVEGLGYKVKSDPFRALFLRFAFKSAIRIPKSQIETIPNRNNPKSEIPNQNAVSPDWFLSRVFSFCVFFSVAMSCSRFLTK